MPRNALQTVPEMRPTPRNALMGQVSEWLQSARGFANKAQIPAGVPLLGGQGVGDMVLGQIPEELNEWSYGNAPMRINPLAGRTASYVPEILAYSATDPDGPFLIWRCTTKAQPITRTLHCIEAPWAAIDLRRLGDRADTIRKAADPQLAWDAAYKRFVTTKSARCAEWLRMLTS